MHVPEVAGDGRIAQSGRERYMGEGICVASEKHRNVYAIGEKIWKIGLKVTVWRCRQSSVLVQGLSLIHI